MSEKVNITDRGAQELSTKTLQRGTSYETNFVHQPLALKLIKFGKKWQPCKASGFVSFAQLFLELLFHSYKNIFLTKNGWYIFHKV